MMQSFRGQILFNFVTFSYSTNLISRGGLDNPDDELFCVEKTLSRIKVNRGRHVLRKQATSLLNLQEKQLSKPVHGSPIFKYISTLLSPVIC